MKLNKKFVNQKKFKITPSGTFTKDAKDIVKSEKFQKLVKTLKPISELNNDLNPEEEFDKLVKHAGIEFENSSEHISYYMMFLNGWCARNGEALFQSDNDTTNKKKPEPPSPPKPRILKNYDH